MTDWTVQCGRDSRDSECRSEERTAARATGDIHFEFLNVKPGTCELRLVDQLAERLEARGRGGATLNPKAVPVVVGDKDILDITLNAR